MSKTGKYEGLNNSHIVIFDILFFTLILGVVTNYKAESKGSFGMFILLYLSSIIINSVVLPIR